LTNSDCLDGGVCAANQCKAAPKPCKSSKECPVVCDPQKGVCVEWATAEDCPPNQHCGANGACAFDVCQQGACVVSQFFACKPDGSGFEAGKACDDGDTCTTDQCANGKCTAGAPKVCNDGNPCTEGDACQQGRCVGKAKACDDGNPCTSDSCQGGKCSNAVKTGACDDNDPCTQGESCVGGKCQGGQAKSCDDGSSCTLDGCNPTKGCTVVAQDGMACSDGDGCSVNDACVLGVCGQAQGVRRRQLVHGRQLRVRRVPGAQQHPTVQGGDGLRCVQRRQVPGRGGRFRRRAGRVEERGLFRHCGGSGRRLGARRQHDQQGHRQR
jgi:hypothetical protein